MSVTCEASQFGPAEKELLERLLGESIAPGEKVLIHKIRWDQTASESEREAARQRLLQMMEANHRRAVANGVTEEEANAAVDEAMEFVRGRKS